MAEGSPEDHELHRREHVHEGVTMALYISLSLLAVLVALPSNLNPSESATPALTIFLTSVGLILAHAVAFRISTRLVNRGQLTAANVELLSAQFIGGLAVTVVAVTPVLLIGGRNGIRVSELLLLAFIAVVGYVAARAVPVSRTRALTYVTAVVALTLVVLWVKNLVQH
jgi:hypothetical protein